ncbi:DUF4097 family beta strand repeat-containing protein [Catenulispora subtropica]|uniref:DUF4097 family beta strand repeat-containing protein n=1 Tax=Catenulispora subtropica TaxID=450798 RepID=A0ABP5DV38_9ACTN
MPTFPTLAPITAKLTVGGARVRVIASDRSDTVVRVEPIDAANKTDQKVVENTKVDFFAGELSVETKKAGGRDGSVAITVELPTGSDLVFQIAKSDVRAEGVFGDCDLQMASGQVRLDRVAALRARLASGDVEVAHVAGPSTVDGATADLRFAELDGTLTYEGANGKVWIGHARASVTLSGASGSFTIDRADADVTAKAAACPIRIGRLTRGTTELMNASHGIEIGIAEGTAAWVDAKSTKGSVRSTLPPQENPEEFAEQVKVYARTRLDDIVIQRATV